MTDRDQVKRERAKLKELEEADEDRLSKLLTRLSKIDRERAHIVEQIDKLEAKYGADAVHAASPTVTVRPRGRPKRKAPREYELMHLAQFIDEWVEDLRAEGMPSPEKKVFELLKQQFELVASDQTLREYHARGKKLLREYKGGLDSKARTKRK